VPEPGNPQSLNRYSYVNNRPAQFTDPGGHYGEDVHYGLARNKAIQSGINTLKAQYGLTLVQAYALVKPLAERIAAGDQGTDCKVCVLDNSAVPEAGEIHWRTLKRAESKIFFEALGAHYSTPEDFGRVLHGVQDYYAHRARGYTGHFGFEGFQEYIKGVNFDGERFDLRAALNSFQWGHMGASAPVRGLDWTTPGPGDPDFIDWDHLTQADKEMIARTEYWTMLYFYYYFSYYFAEHPDELQRLREEQDQEQGN
jgi:hypothetical protein